VQSNENFMQFGISKESRRNQNSVVSGDRDPTTIESLMV
jgi:hypothetical protein